MDGNTKVEVNSIKEKSEINSKVLLILTLIFGFLFRLINVNTRELLGDPPHFNIQAINFLHSGLLIVWDQSTYLWYAFTNIFYNIFGITQFATRSSSLLFGTASILVIYLFVLEFSGKKNLALVSAMIYAFAPGIIWQVADEHDISALFFILTSFYTLIYGLKRNSKRYLIFSGVIFAISAMWKAYVAILLIPYLGLIYYFHRTNRFNIKNNYKTLIWVLVLIGILVSPTFVYNYSNYKHNGVVDFIFANSLNIKSDKISALYGWTSAQEISNSGNIFNSFYRMFIGQKMSGGEVKPPIIYYALKSLYSTGHILFFMAIIGAIYLFLKRKEQFAKDYLIFFGLYFIIPFLFISYGNYLSKHLVQFIIFAIPMVAYFIVSVYNYCNSKFNFVNSFSSKKALVYMGYAVLIFFIFFVLLSIVTPQYQSFMSPNPQGKFIDYKLKNIPQDALIIYDDRFYNSEAGWLFNDRYYIPVSFLNTFNSYNENSTSREIVSVYLIECAIDDCGWGTVGSNPQLNNSMEAFFDSAKNQSIPLVYNAKSKISGVSYYNPLISGKVESPDYLNVYKTSMNVDLNLARQVKMQYEYFLYPTGYLNKNSRTFKNFIYTPDSSFEILINKLAWFVFYLNIILSFLILIFVLFETYLRL